jgi:hypothetical protein
LKNSTSANSGFAIVRDFRKFKDFRYSDVWFIIERFFYIYPHHRKAAERWEKSPFGTIFPNDRPAPPTVGKPSLHSHDAFPTAAFDAFRIGAKKLLPETTTNPGGHSR